MHLYLLVVLLFVYFNLLLYFCFVVVTVCICRSVHGYVLITLSILVFLPSFTNTQLSDAKVGGATVYPMLKVRVPPVQVQVDWYTVGAV